MASDRSSSTAKTKSNQPTKGQESTLSQDSPHPNIISVDDVNYDADSMPDEIKALLRDLLRFNQEAEELQYRLRQIQAAQQTYYETIKDQLAKKNVNPVSKSLPG